MIDTKMEPFAVVNRVRRALRSVIAVVLEPLPPYHLIEGRLLDKEAGPDGGYYLLIDTETVPEMVDVDSYTFDTLMLGEALRVRCTRSNKAISIDRLVP